MDLTLQAFGCGFVGALVEVAVHIEDGPYGRVAEAVGDHLRVLALGDKERHLRTSERVSAEAGIKVCDVEGGLPDATDPCRPANWPTLRCREDPVLRSRWLQPGHVVDELLGDRPGECHRSDALGRLGWADDDFAAHVGRRSADSDETAERVEVAELETGELSDAEPAEGTDKHECPVARIDRIGEKHHLLDREGDRLAPFDLR